MIILSIKIHCTEQVYFGYNYKESKRRGGIEGTGREREYFVYILAQRPYTICVIYLIDTILTKQITGGIKAYKDKCRHKRS